MNISQGMTKGQGYEEIMPLSAIFLLYCGGGNRRQTLKDGNQTHNLIS